MKKLVLFVVVGLLLIAGVQAVPWSTGTGSGNVSSSVDTFSFVVASDVNPDARHPSEYNDQVTEAAGAILGLNPDLVLLAGDLVAGQIPLRSNARDVDHYREIMTAAWEAFDQSFNRYLSPLLVFPSPGNHDTGGLRSDLAAYRQPMLDTYSNYWNSHRPAVTLLPNGNYPYYYSFNQQYAGLNYHFIMLDASLIRMTEAQLDWLREDLRQYAPSSTAIFVIGHVPPVTFQGAHYSSTLQPQSEIIDIVDDYSGKLHWFAGHQQMFYEDVINNVHITFTGAVSGARGDGRESFALVEVRGANIEVTRVTGDQFQQLIPSGTFNGTIQTPVPPPSTPQTPSTTSGGTTQRIARTIAGCLSTERCKQIDEVWLRFAINIGLPNSHLVWDHNAGRFVNFEDLYYETRVTGGTSPALTQIGQRIAQVALREYERWDFGQLREQQMVSVVGEYRQIAGCVINNPISAAWSGAFISYVMAEAGVTDFQTSCLHSSYFARTRDNPATCVAHPMSEVNNINVGDILCACRGSGCPTTFATASGEGHCDIVVERNGDSIALIGGNVNENVDRITKSISQLNEPPYYGFISCGSTSQNQPVAYNPGQRILVSDPNCPFTGAPNYGCQILSSQTRVQFTPQSPACVAQYGTPEVRAMLDTIAWSEGTDAYYDLMLGHRIFTDLSTHPNATGEMPPLGFPFGSQGRTSTAAGRYQFLGRTYLGLVNRGYFTTGFGPLEQDKAAADDLLARKRGVTQVMIEEAERTGNFATIWNAIDEEWTSIDGHPSSDLEQVFRNCLAYHQQNP